MRASGGTELSRAVEREACAAESADWAGRRQLLAANGWLRAGWWRDGGSGSVAGR